MSEQHEEHAKHKGHKGGGGHGAHGKHEEHEEGVAEWVVSFADNALLQMGFFVILLAMNLKEPTTGGVGGKDQKGTQPQSEAMLDMMISIRDAFNNPVSPNSMDPREAALVQRLRQKKEGDSRQKGPPGDMQDVQSVRPTDYHRIGGVVTFEEGAASIDATGQNTAATVARELKGRKSIVEVRGHVSLSEASEPLDKGMSLSFQRALAVAQVLRTAGLDWDQMRVVACGSGDRIKPLARTMADHQNNQRVEIIVTDEQVPADPYARDPGSGGVRTVTVPTAE